MDKRILFDEEDEKLILSHRWSIKHSSKKHKKLFEYARTYIDGKSVTMHRLIMNPPNNLVVDHINHNTLDNRRSNLRVVTHRENLANRDPNRDPNRERNANTYSELPMARNTSGFRGVHWDKERGKWRAYIIKNGKNMNLGRFDDILEAAKAYKKANKFYNLH